ncbi:DUF1627 domain-containing protein, partial [Escherichia coli]
MVTATGRLARVNQNG